MFTFYSRLIDDIVLEYPNKIGSNCKEYIIEHDAVSVGQIQSADTFALLKYQSQTILINRKKFYFEPKVYFLKHWLKDENIGSIEFLCNQVEGIFSLIDGSTYFFHKNSFHKNLLKPKTWFQYEHHFTDSEDDIVYNRKTNLNSLPSGNIETSNGLLILPMLIGLFIMEENSRAFAENAG